MSDSAINQQLEKMETRGLIPKEVMHGEPFALAASTIVADMVDAVRWHDQKDEELKALKMQDVNHQKAWLDTLIEDFIAFDPTPSDSAEKAAEILTELDKELSKVEEGGYGPDASDYIYKMKRELELVIEKLKAPDATPQTKTEDEKEEQDTGVVDTRLSVDQ